MSVIEASAAGFKDMADGTVRFFFDVEPRHAGAALELFRARGTPAALAALKVGHAAVQEPELKGGPLAREAGKLDSNPAFLQFAEQHGFNCARWMVLDWCEVQSRRELDHQPEAATRFRQLMRKFADSQKAAA